MVLYVALNFIFIFKLYLKIVYIYFYFVCNRNKIRIFFDLTVKNNFFLEVHKEKVRNNALFISKFNYLYRAIRENILQVFLYCALKFYISSMYQVL